MKAATMLLLAAFPLAAAPPQMGRGNPGIELDLEGKTAEARALFQKAIDSAATPGARAQAERNMAMSWAFDGNCRKTAEYEDRVIEYWKTQEAANPGNAFYQEGEMADEAARVCIDQGDLAKAAEEYKKGHELAIREPNLSPARKDLWDFRYEHALARLAARGGDRAEALKHVAAARAILDDMKSKDEGLYRQQTGFLPYLTGYVAFYAGDYRTALADFQQDPRGDAFIECMIGMTYEKLGEQAKAMEAYRRASGVRAHNPPAAFAVPLTRKKLAEE